MGNPYAPPSAPGRGPSDERGEPAQRPSDVPGATRRSSERGADDGSGGQGHPGAPEPRRARPRATPAQVRTASRRTVAATACTLGALVTSALPLPGPALGAAFALAAVVLGIRALVSVVSAGLQRSLLPVVTIGLAMALLYLVGSLSLIATWPIQQERQDCLARALTVSARDACHADYREAIERLSRDGS